jgi:hypothetical protein
LKVFIWGTVGILLYFTYGFYASQAEIQIVPPKIEKINPNGFNDYRGVINVHTDMGIGSNSPLEIIEEAKKAGLDFLMFNDLDIFNIPPGLEGYHSGLIALWGSQHRYLDNRLLMYSPDKKLYPTDSNDAQIKLTDYLSQSSSANKELLFVLSHSSKAPLKWTGPMPTGLDGLQIINPKAMSERRLQENPFSVIWSFFTYPFSPRLAFLRLINEPRDELALWDQLGQERAAIGITGGDITARAIPLANYFIKFPSYYRSFGVSSIHLILRSELTGNFVADRLKVFAALKSGQFYNSFDLIGDPTGFNFYATNNDQTHLMGSKIQFTPGMKLRFELGARPVVHFEVVVLKDGQRLKSLTSTNGEFSIEGPGVYRAIVRVIPFFPFPEGKKWITWIYSNPIFIK